MELIKRIKEFLVQCKRVLKVATKPKKEEFFMVAKVCALGIILLGLIGLIVHIIFFYLPK